VSEQGAKSFMGISLNKQVSITNVIGWFFTIIGFVWFVAFALSEANARIDNNEKNLKDHKIMIKKLTDSNSIHREKLIKLKAKDENFDEQLKQIKKNTEYNRDKLDKIYDKISK
jgi:septal ring factor EnvC (AmiA/AmiB activator)